MSGPIPQQLKTVRNERALLLRPAIGKGTGKTRVSLREGLTCDIEDGQCKLTAGASEGSGGDNGGPDPGTFGRGALGACLAMGYANWAAKLGVPVEAIEVEVEADYDARRAHAEYMQSISGFRRADGRYDIPGEFVAVSGRKNS